jgi:hypothetical protein
MGMKLFHWIEGEPVDKPTPDLADAEAEALAEIAEGLAELEPEARYDRSRIKCRSCGLAVRGNESNIPFGWRLEYSGMTGYRYTCADCGEPEAA